jgi:type IV secretion system protein VirD4
LDCFQYIPVFGQFAVQKASFNFSGSRLAPIANHMSASVDHIERPLMTPDEVMRLKPPKKSGSGSSERITAPGDMLIFVSGHHPIYGTQILYFSDPVLAKRAAIPPPTTFVAIADGEVIEQAAEDRTPNIISRPEVVEAPVSPMEKAFTAALSGATNEPSARVRSSPAPAHGFIEQLTHSDGDE